MFRLLRDGCFFINHHHHIRITLPTIHFHQPNLTQFCLCCELCLLRCLGYLGTMLPTPTPCIVNHLTLDFRIAYSKTHHCISAIPLSFRKTTTAFRYHHLTFAFEILSSRYFSFPKVFRLIRNGSTSATPPVIIAEDSNLDDTIVYSPCNCIYNP